METDVALEVELALSRAIDHSFEQYFKNEDWQFQESECFTGNAQEQFSGLGGLGILLHFVNPKTEEEKTIKLPMKV